MNAIVGRFIILASFLCVCSASAQVVVRKSAGEADPTVFFKGVAGDQELSNCVLSDLKNCGWFTVVNAPPANFEVSGQGGAGGATLTTSNGIKVSSPNASSPRWTAHKLVDGLLKQVFQIPGICSSRIAFVGQIGSVKEIFVCDFDGANLQQVTNNQNLSIGPHWGLNNKMLVYTFFGRTYTDVVGLDLNTKATSRLAQFPGMNTAGAISPTGKHLAIILSKDRRVELYVKDLFGQGLRRVTNSNDVEASPCWSPTGDRICFVSDATGRPKLSIYSVVGNQIQSISTIGSEAVSPDWSKKDDMIVYSAKFGPNYSIAINYLAANNSEKVEIKGGGDWESPSWAPDSRHIVCARRASYKSDIFVVDTKTGEVRQLLSSQYNLSLPRWSELYQ